MSSTFFGDRSNPMSPEILPSTTPSPRIIKPPLHGQIPKQRSSSVNSTGSNHQSVVSLDSPRNSIISLDDVRPLTRNNSTTSLTSITNTSKEPTVLSRGKFKFKGHFSTSAVFSDEDSEIDKPTTLPAHGPQLLAKKIRRRKDSFESRSDPIKRDFQFQFSNPPIQNVTKSPIPPKAEVKHEDNTPSPLSLLSNDSSTPSKKVKSSKTNISQSLLLKKKIYSKDIQLELIPSPTQIINKEAKRFADKKSALRDSFSDAPILSTLNHQNQLISEMNRKWNKSLEAPKRTKYKSTSPVSSDPRESRKRPRAYSFGDEGDDEESFNEL
ncbi:hypothetical protein PGUG_05310 [Meyerozyma guilliermondii ATCC 6260]|uniref:Uncharacterized protein n=1 Tax=Meyerozyma guilliermondii (strain ATCC 6260 / CBS 566 / DSM 6381 / JCM 1539 / NBRC 10279 / NRRL Y-324) TaxID=294746 RepID=A5DPV9_PICGU|nr:uncharacterized protein PGUG_05310 [Meyerozyma guilliermondii ATCC 6260]EDK41212.2 hypothetical protein PGUG_05310 [Meyerozyma guilliermondii ATCC 6260]